MSYPTRPVWIETAKGWEERLKVHPVFAWMFEYGPGFDSGRTKSDPHTVWHTDDYIYVKPDGTPGKPGADSWEVAKKMYANFTEHYHEPREIIVWETETGYEMVGFAHIFANLPTAAEKTVADLEGRKWHVGVPGSFKFVYVKDASGPQGLKIKYQATMGDGIGILKAVVESGMAPADQALALLSQ
jgi:hypothetical protein